MKYRPMFDVWKLSPAQLRLIQPGQMVFAGDRKTTGRFFGVKRSGTVVVAWSGNVSSRKNKREYLRALCDYAKGN